MTLSPDLEAEQPPVPAGPPSPDPRVRTAAILIAATIALLAIGAWFATRPAPESAGEAGEGDVPWMGREVPAQDKPPIVLTDTDGNPYDLQAATDGKLTLLMFGYTNCPDVCPISLGTLAGALDELGTNVSNRVQLVFVTADPARDTPEVLRSYLDRFDPSYVGLTGTPEQVAEAQRLADVPPAVVEDPDPDGDYTVGHATQIIAYQPDDTARMVYPFGTRQQDWILDLPRLLAGEVPQG